MPLNSWSSCLSSSTCVTDLFYHLLIPFFSFFRGRCSSVVEFLFCIYKVQDSKLNNTKTKQNKTNILFLFWSRFWMHRQPRIVLKLWSACCTRTRTHDIAKVKTEYRRLLTWWSSMRSPVIWIFFLHGHQLPETIAELKNNQSELPSIFKNYL